MLSQKAKVILDTNFLLIPGLFKVDVFSEIDQLVRVLFEFWIVSQTLAELDKIANEKGKREDVLAAKLALVFIKQKSLKIARGSKGESADDAIARLARQGDMVATQDQGLKKRLRPHGIRVIVLRQKTHVSFEN